MCASFLSFAHATEFVYFSSLCTQLRDCHHFHVEASVLLAVGLMAICRVYALQVFMDASSISKRPVELVWLWSPEKQIGGWCPPIVRLSKLALQRVRCPRVCLCILSQHTRDPDTSGSMCSAFPFQLNEIK